MTCWFHRNPLKATANQLFNLRGVASSTDASKICVQAAEVRRALLGLLSDPGSGVQSVEQNFSNYLKLLYGFIWSVESEAQDSKMRFGIKFRWTNSLRGPLIEEQQDAIFELCHMLVNVAIWYSKHAAAVSIRNAEPSMDDAKEVLTSLKTAATLFKQVGDYSCKLLPSQTLDGLSDLKDDILHVYYLQSVAEAQEVTVGRAIELKHSPDLISGLAYDTAQQFQAGARTLKAIEQSEDPMVKKWMLYLVIKHHFYSAYAYSFHGDSLLAADKCGEAIRALKEAQNHYIKSQQACDLYIKTKADVRSAKPEQHSFFKKLGFKLKLTIEKCERENGMIYHQKVPESMPELELEAKFGIIKIEKGEHPGRHELWTANVYKAFDLTKMSNLRGNEKPGEGKEEKNVAPNKEKPLDPKNEDHKSDSGCSVM